MAQGGPLSARDHLVGLASLAPRAVRASWMGGIVFAVCLALTAAWALSSKRLYRSEAVLVYERGVQSTSLGAGAEGDAPHQVGARVTDMVKARQRLETLIKTMKLYPAIVDQRGLGEAIEEMGRRINIHSDGGYTFRISFDADSREAAQLALDRLLRGMVEEDTARRMRQADDARKFLQAERKHADEDLKIKESALAQFLSEHPKLAEESSGGRAAAGALMRADLREQQSGSGGEIAALELQAAQLEDSLRQANASPAEVPGDPVLSQARGRAHAELQAAQRDLADKQARYTNEHPDVKAALRHVADAEAALRRADAAAASSRAHAPVERGADDEAGGRNAGLRRALAAVRSQIAVIKGRAAPRSPVSSHGPRSVVAIDTEFTRLTREASEARERQGQLEGKQFQAELTATLTASGKAGRLVIADPPFRPIRPITGGRFKIALVGGAVSVLLALLGIGVMAAFDDRLYSAGDVGRVVDDQIVVVIPRLTEKGG